MRTSWKHAALAVAMALGAVAGPLAPAAQAAQALCNGGFETTGCWTSTNPEQAGRTNATSRTGSYSAQVCASDGCEATLTQKYTVPRNVISGSFRYWYTSYSSDFSCDDNLRAGVVSADGMDGIPAEPFLSCPGQTNGVWTQRSAPATEFLKRHEGESVTVQFTASNNGALQTSWYIDDVVLDVVAGHARSVSLSLRNHLVARGAVVGDGYGRCVRDVPVRIQRRKDGTWNTIKTTRTASDGTYRVPLEDRRGTYRAVVAEFSPVSGHRCLRDTSAWKQHEH